MNKNHACSNKLIAATLSLAIFGWSALFVWQGLDFTDMGFSLASYQQFYTAPQTNTYFLLNWLTVFIGHWLGEPFGGTVIAYKLSASVIAALTGLIAYLGLQAALGKGWAPASFVFVTFLFATKSTTNWISYNDLTALFYTLGAVLLLVGLIQERQRWVMLAGLVLGANLFIRFPNLLGISLVIAVALHAWLQRWSWNKARRWSAVYLLGWLLGVALIAVLIVAHGHADYYWQSLQGIFGKAADDNSTHSSSMLIKLFIRDHLYAGILAALVIGAGVLILRLIGERTRAIKTSALLLSALILAAALSARDSWTWAVPGLLYLGLLWIAYREWRARPHLVLFAFIALSVLILAPLGSNNGLRNAIYGQWLALPLLLTWLWQSTATATALPFIHQPLAGRLATVTLATALVGLSVLTSWFYTYRDSPQRLALTQPVSHPLLIGTHTTEARARIVSELLDELPTWIAPGDALLAYPDIPTVHYLTRTTAWLENPWPILYREVETEHRLAQKRADNAPRPVVVRSLGVTRNFVWPIDSPRAETPKRETSRAVFDRFVADTGYRSVWSNGFFEILVPTPP